jgi:hypothetical protein
MPGRHIDCHACEHYVVTWDNHFPHGCRRMGFKGRRMPNEEVRQAMGGQDCALFQPKAPRKKRNPVGGVVK